MNEIWRDWRSAEAEAAPIPRTLIPQFTLRWLLCLTTVCACLLSVVAWGMRGQAWAVGVSMVFGSLALAMLVQGFVFLVVWCVSLVPRPGRGRRGKSPFLAEGISADAVDSPIDAVLAEEDVAEDEVREEAIREEDG